MELTHKLRHIFISDLEKCSPLMEEDLKGLLTNSTIPYLEGKDETDVRAFCFEYDHDDMSISFYALGEKNEIISDICLLLTEREENHFPSDRYASQEEILEDLLSEYRKEKLSIFTHWFIARWKNITEQLNIMIDAYFSKINAFYKTDLNSLEPISSEEIEEKYNT